MKAPRRCWTRSRCGGTQYRRLVGAFQRIFGATIFFGTDSQRERAAVVHRARFNFMSEARIWYSRDPDQKLLPRNCQNVIVLSEEFYREILDHLIPTDLEAAKALSSSPAAPPYEPFPMAGILGRRSQHIAERGWKCCQKPRDAFSAVCSAAQRGPVVGPGAGSDLSVDARRTEALEVRAIAPIAVWRRASGGPSSAAQARVKAWDVGAQLRTSRDALMAITATRPWLTELLVLRDRGILGATVNHTYEADQARLHGGVAHWPPRTGLDVFACFLSSFETAALEPRINASGDLGPQADVRTHQCIDLGMIQFPPLLAKSLKRASRSPRELDS